MNRIVLTLAAIVLVCGAGKVLAQADKTYPDRPVRIVVPWAAGGNADVLTRVMAQKLTEVMGQQVVVDNRGGANGMIGSELVVRSRPDGYTLLVDGVQTHAINPLVFSKMAYVTQRDLAPVTLLGGVLHILVAHPSLPIRNTADLIALAKAHPREIAYASFGPGTLSHLAGELFQQITGTRMLHVPYKGGGPALVAQLSGEVSLYYPGFAIALPHVKSGKLRALGMASKVRSADLPDLPTLAEQLKAPQYDITTVFAIMVPAETSKSVVGKLHSGLAQALTSPDVRKRYSSMGAASMPALSPDETLSMMRSEAERWGKVVRAADIKSN